MWLVPIPGHLEVAPACDPRRRAAINGSPSGGSKCAHQKVAQGCGQLLGSARMRAASSQVRHVAVGVRLGRTWRICRCCNEAPGCGPPRYGSQHRLQPKGNASLSGYRLVLKLAMAPQRCAPHLKCGLHSALHPRHCVRPAKSNGTGRSTMVYPAGQRGHVTQADIKSTFYWQQAIVRPSKFCKVAAAAGRRPGAGRQLPSAHVAAGVRLDRKWQITKCCCEAPGCGPPRLSSRRRQLREGDASSVRHREAQRCLRSHCGHARRQFNMQAFVDVA